MRKVLTLACLGLLGGCANLAPQYTRPAAPVAAQLSSATASSDAASLPAWQDLISDARLKEVIRLALANNRNLRSTALNVEKVRTQYRIAEADRYPTVSASLADSTSKSSGKITRKYTAQLGVSYELDFFGRIGNLSDAALETYFATEASQRSTRISLIADVANTWLAVAADQGLLRVARETLETRQRTLDLYLKQKALGAVSELTVSTQEALTEAARADVASYQSQLAQDRNALMLLVGGEVPANLLSGEADAIETPAAQLLALPAGLSSQTLLQRPDIMAAEHNLKAAYADIGAARAAFFPSISLTVAGGSSSASLGGLFKAGSEVWSFAPTISMPIFNAGSLRASLSVAELSRDMQIAAYEYAIQTAFKEVNNALAERAEINTRLQAQQKQVEIYKKALMLTQAQFEKGSSNYLTVLDAQRSYYSAQQNMINLQLTEQNNRITLFKVLGGGSV